MLFGIVVISWKESMQKGTKVVGVGGGLKLEVGRWAWVFQSSPLSVV